MTWLSLLLLMVTPFKADDYVAQLERDRQKIDLEFADPLNSPLGTFAVVLVTKPVTLIGDSPEADAGCGGCNLRPRHAKLIKTRDGFLLEPLEGTVFEVAPDASGGKDDGARKGGSPVGKRPWSVGRKFWMGDVVLALQMHPVGPVLRFIRPDAPRTRGFAGLKYFPIAASYRLRARIDRTQLRPVTIIDTKGWERSGFVFGKVRFELAGRPRQLDLIVFERHPQADSQFLVMFKDSTNGVETYPAGRYLYIPFQPDGETWIDFNTASNPYCAYGDGFACPLPLPGNRLDVPVRAGEKIYSRH